MRAFAHPFLYSGSIYLKGIRMRIVISEINQELAFNRGMSVGNNHSVCCISALSSSLKSNSYHGCNHSEGGGIGQIRYGASLFWADESVLFNKTIDCLILKNSQSRIGANDCMYHGTNF